MSSTAQRALKAYLWFIAAFHLFVGLSVNLSEPFTRVIAAGYGAQVDWTAQFVSILHPLGAFMIVLGLLAAAAAREPERYEAVVLGFVVLFAIRAVHRLVFGADITSAFGIAPSRNTMSMVVFAVQSVALLLLWRAARAPRRAASFATS